MDTIFVVQISESCGVTYSPNTYKKESDAIEFLEECLKRHGCDISEMEIDCRMIAAETYDRDLEIITYSGKDICGQIIECELR